MKRLLFLLSILLCVAFAARGQDRIQRSGAKVQTNSDGSVTITTASGKTLHLTPQAGVAPTPCTDGSFYARTNVGVYYCTNTTWALLGSGGGGGATIPSVTNLIKGDGVGNGADSGIDPANVVQSTRTVNSHALSANVTVTKSDVGLGNVDNTSDANKPVSTAQAAADALNLKIASNLSDLNNAATARTNLGGTTVGIGFFTFTNPSAIRFPRIEADNTVTGRTAAQLLSDIGAQASLGFTPLNAASNLSDLANAGTARTNLGGSTVGQNIFTLTNPSAVRFLQINADNTVTAQAAATQLSSLGGQAGPLTGDVTTSGAAATIANNAITNAKLAQMGAHTFKGNNTGSTANALDLTATQLTAELNAMVGDSGSGGTKGLVPAPAAGDATKCLSGAATYIACSGGSGAPTGAQYVVLALDATLTAERVLTGTANKVTLTDGGANGNITLNVGNTVVQTDAASTYTSGTQDFTAVTNYVAGFKRKRTATATSYTVLATDGYVGVTDTSAARTITLPDLGTADAGFEVTIADESNGATTNNISIVAGGSDTFINGFSSPIVIDVNNGSVTLYWTGTSATAGWRIK